jgi:hypothetical protein
VSGKVILAGEHCQNCKSPLHGPYCAACGQRHEPHIHSIREFGSEAFETVTHADSRLWRTLWLLVAKPGFLTKEFLEGRRARYLPPFRLYLVLSVLLFLVVALMSDSSISLPNASNPADSLEARAQRNCQWRSDVLPQHWLPRLNESCRKMVMDDGHAFVQAMIHNIPRALFLLLPLLALVMRAMYRRRHYVEHLLFFTHNHAFTFVLYTVLLIALMLTSWGWLNAIWITALVVWPPLYTYKAMRRVYAQGRWMTRLKFLVLTAAYLTLMIMMALFTALYSMVTL